MSLEEFFNAHCLDCPYNPLSLSQQTRWSFFGRHKQSADPLGLVMIPFLQYWEIRGLWLRLPLCTLDPNMVVFPLMVRYTHVTDKAPFICLYGMGYPVGYWCS